MGKIKKQGYAVLQLTIDFWDFGGYTVKVRKAYVNMGKNLREHLNLLKRSYPTLRNTYSVHRIGIFGSVARGTQVHGSDVDIVVEFAQPITIFDFMEMEIYLKKVLRKPVDVVSTKALKPSIKKEVLKETVYA